MSDFYDGKVRTARKPHKCGECGGVIQPGEVYNLHAGVWEGDFWSIKNCSDCEQLRFDHDDELEYEDKAPFGSLAQYCCDAYTDNGDRKLHCDMLKIQKKRGVSLRFQSEEFLIDYEKERGEG